MKKFIFYISILLVVSSCSLNDDNTSPNFFLEIIPIQSVDIPTEFVRGETYTISMTYIQPTECYQFNDFIYQVNDNERTVAVVNTVFTDESCDTTPEEVEVSFDFFVTDLQTYVFRFYQGTNAQDEDQYLIIEVPVVESAD